MRDLKTLPSSAADSLDAHIKGSSLIEARRLRKGLGNSMVNRAVNVKQGKSELNCRILDFSRFFMRVIAMRSFDRCQKGIPAT